MKNKVKEFRLKEGLTQEELAEKAGISRTIISGFENQNIDITTNTTMQKIAKALNQQVETIFFLNNSYSE